MIQAILVWTPSMVGLSYLVPYMIPSFRSALKQIYENKRTNNVFGGDCINDIQQNQINAIDRTVGQLVASFCQTIIVLWALSNLVVGTSINSLHYFSMSYYLYDMIYLFIKPFGKTQTIFHLHHIACITMILYVLYIPLGYTNTMNVFYILMELSALSINLSNVQRYLYPASRLTIQVSLANLIIFFLTRIILFPGIFLYQAMTFNRENMLAYLFPGSFFLLLFFVSLWWYIGMADKHKCLERKMIL